MEDSCVIQKSQLNGAQKSLRSKLYDLPAPEPSPAQSEHSVGFKTPSLAQTGAAPAEAVQNYSAQMSAVNEEKMDGFLGDVRSHIFQAQSQGQLPLNMLAQQTQMVNNLTRMQEENQKIFAAMASQDKAASNTAQIRQELYNDNRRMMGELLAPLSRQVQEFKELHSSTKQFSQAAVHKMERLEKQLSQGPGSLAGPMLSSFIEPQQLTQPVVDPAIFKSNLEEIRDHMKELQ